MTRHGQRPKQGLPELGTLLLPLWPALPASAAGPAKRGAAGPGPVRKLTALLWTGRLSRGITFPPGLKQGPFGRIKARQNGPGRWTLDPLGPFLFYFLFKSRPDSGTHQQRKERKNAPRRGKCATGVLRVKRTRPPGQSEGRTNGCGTLCVCFGRGCAW
jgi:hypothetical protein